VAPPLVSPQSNTGGAGRGSYKGDIIGDVIFHGKKEYWAPGQDYHYHATLEAGDNTLEGKQPIMTYKQRILKHLI
jgi:hypothetical protein